MKKNIKYILICLAFISGNTSIISVSANSVQSHVTFCSDKVIKPSTGGSGPDNGSSPTESGNNPSAGNLPVQESSYPTINGTTLLGKKLPNTGALEGLIASIAMMLIVFLLSIMIVFDFQCRDQILKRRRML